MNRVLFALVSFALMACVPASSQQREAASSADLVASAEAFVDLLAKKDFSSAETYFDDTMKTALPQAKLQETWNALITQAGELRRRVRTRTEERNGYNVVIIACEFEKAPVDIQVVFDQAKRIAGLFFAPGKIDTEYSPPSYVKPNAFREKEVKVGAGEWELPGTLTLPMGLGSFPAVVLVHGSGQVIGTKRSARTNHFGTWRGDWHHRESPCSATKSEPSSMQPRQVQSVRLPLRKKPLTTRLPPLPYCERQKG